MLAPLIDSLGRDDIRLVPVRNDFFGGNIGVSGLLTGTDLTTVLTDQPEGHRYLLPDSCLSEGRFLDDLTLADLPRTVEVVPTDGLSLRRALDGRPPPRPGSPRPGAGHAGSPTMTPAKPESPIRTTAPGGGGRPTRTSASPPWSTASSAAGPPWSRSARA